MAAIENGSNFEVAASSVDSPLGGISLQTAKRTSVSAVELRASESFDSETSFRGMLTPPMSSRYLLDYPNDCPLEEFIHEIASQVHRPIEKANEWLLKLMEEDMMTVGDLRNLHDEDWTRLTLTVFATRLIRNALKMKTKNMPAILEQFSPRESGHFAETQQSAAVPSISGSSSSGSSVSAPLSSSVIFPPVQ